MQEDFEAKKEGRARWPTEAEFGAKAKRVMAVASAAQKTVLDDFQAGTERFFLAWIQEPINEASIDDTLQIMVNNVEGDTSQLEPEHEKYARKKGWLDGWE